MRTRLSVDLLPRTSHEAYDFESCPFYPVSVILPLSAKYVVDGSLALESCPRKLSPLPSVVPLLFFLERHVNSSAPVLSYREKFGVCGHIRRHASCQLLDLDPYVA